MGADATNAGDRGRASPGRPAVSQRWPELGRSDAIRCGLDRAALIATVMERYGRRRDAVERDVDDFLRAVAAPQPPLGS